jgi:uncharacterized protein (DUF1778 family)
MKTGRPRLSDAEKKGQITGVRLNDNERSIVEKAASISGQTLSGWIRETLLSRAGIQTRQTKD